MKSCTCCGRTHSTADWANLTYVGEVDGGRLELRNCQCGSTLAMTVEVEMPYVRPDEADGLPGWYERPHD